MTQLTKTAIRGCMLFEREEGLRHPRARVRRELSTGHRSPQFTGLRHEGYSGVVLRMWGVGVVVVVCSGRLRVRRGSRARRDRRAGCRGRSGRRRGRFRRPRPAGRPAWWDGVSHVVTRPGSRARHLTREHVTRPASTYLDPRARTSSRRSRGLSDDLGGYPTISRTAAPGAAAPRTPRCASRPRERRLNHRVAQPHLNGPNRRAPP